MAAAKFIQRGDNIDYTPGVAVPQGTVVIFTGVGGGRLVGITNADIAANELGSASLVGAYEVDKLTTDAGDPGDKMYWDAGNSRATRTASTHALMGALIKSCVNGDTRCRIRLDGTVF